MPDATAPILVKRYPADRLYDVIRGRYVTLDQLRDWRARHVAFRVVDAVTGSDITLVLLA
jgi:polyhydroxyalkanoate synthesis regulator protein